MSIDTRAGVSSESKRDVSAMGERVGAGTGLVADTVPLTGPDPFGGHARAPVADRNVELLGSVLVVNGSGARFGSQDLIRLAGYAADRGFTTISFGVADAALEQFTIERGEWVSMEMVEILERYGVSQLLSAMNDDFDEVYVLSVSLRSEFTGGTVSVGRSGLVVTSVRGEAIRLLTGACVELFA